MSALWRKPLPSPISKRDLFKLERFIGLRLERLALSAKYRLNCFACRFNLLPADAKE